MELSTQTTNTSNEEVEFNRLALLMIDIIKHNPGIEVACNNMPELIKDIFRCTGVLIRTKNVINEYEVMTYNWLGDEIWHNRKRYNRREYHLTTS